MRLKDETLAWLVVDLQSLYNKTTLDEYYGCRIWIGRTNNSGYPTVWDDGRPRQAYLAAWESVHGPIPPFKTVDHICRRRLCIAIPHLELVSQGENTRRIHWSYRSQLDACPMGHDLKQEGRRTPEGGMICRICSGVQIVVTQEPEVR